MDIRVMVADLPARAKVLSAEEMRQVFGGCGAPPQMPRPNQYFQSSNIISTNGGGLIMVSR